MRTDPAAARTAGTVGTWALAGFWVLVVVAGHLQPGYRPSRDYVSALASEGARLPGLGILALVLLGVAYVAAAGVLGRTFGSWFGLALMVGAGLLTWVVAFARIHCPRGAGACLGRDAAPASFGPHLHGWGVAASYTLVAGSMLWLAVTLWLRSRRGLALASAVALVASLATVPSWVGTESPGGAQRLWLGIISAWVVLVCSLPIIAAARPEEEP